MRVNIGDVVLLPYLNFHGEVVRAMFLVIYHEAFDGNMASTNFTGVKVSSSEYHYGIELRKEYLPFLHTDSWLNCNQQHRFTEQQVIRRVGVLNPVISYHVLQQIKNYNAKIERQLNNFVGDYKPRSHR